MVKPQEKINVRKGISRGMIHIVFSAKINQKQIPQTKEPEVDCEG